MTDALLQELRARFRETTEVRLQDVGRLLDVLAADARDTDALQRLARHFHALSGLGATYGYPRISELGDAAEATILPLTKSGAAPAPELLEAWRAILRGVVRELAETRDAPLPSVDVAPRPRRVLVVDDDLVHVMIVRRVLAKAGYDVEVCNHAAEFDACIAAFRPHLVLMDEQLAGASGAELARRVDIPVLFVTGDRDVRARSDVIAKPVAWDVLLARIAERLR